MIRVYCKEDGLFIKAEFKHKALCKQVPGARWQPSIKVWKYAKTPFISKAIHETFSDVCAIDWCKESQELLYKGMCVGKMQGIKDRDDLEDVPVSKTTAWNHQRQAFWFAKDLDAVMLNMDMGTGKSKVTVDLCANRDSKKILIMCPKSVVDVWPNEFKIHAGVDYRCLPLRKGSVAKKKEEAERFIKIYGKTERVVVVINFDSAWREPFASWAKKAGFDCVVVDESHQIKSPTGKRSKFCAAMGKVSPRRIALTGTVMPHSPLDVYGQYRFLDQGIFGTNYSLFKQKYAIMGGFQEKQVLGFRHEQEIHDKMMQIAYRVGKEVLDLPEFTDNERICELPASAKKLYQQLEDEFYAQVETGEVTVSNALTKLLRLQQVTGGFIKKDDDEIENVHDEKKKALMEIIESVGDEPVVSFGRFQYDLDKIKESSEVLGRTCAELSGRENTLEEWKRGEYDDIAIQIQAGGAGISTVRAAYCVYYSLGFSLGDYEQSRARIHRPGQNRAVNYYHLITDGTIDRAVYRALSKRKKVVNDILDMGRG